MRRATLPSGSACIGSEHVRFQAARALLSDVIVTKDLPNNVRRALKKVGDLINPDHENRSGSDLLSIPSPPGISFPHCGGRISVHEDEQLHSGGSIFDWSSVSNVMGLPQFSEDCSRASKPKPEATTAARQGDPPERSSEADQRTRTADVISNEQSRHSDLNIIKVASGQVFQADEISSDCTLAQLDSWTFPVFALSLRCYDTLLSMVAFKAFENTNLFKTFHIDLQKFFNFFHEIEAGYHELPYHNRVHASDVLHACYFLTTHWVPAYADYPAGLVSLLSPVELMALYTAAAIHDHDHPGRNNAFLIATRDPKAIIYNDRSVLENHHISSAWKVLMREENFFVENLSTSELNRFRHFVIETVLSTDLKYHYDLLMSFTDKASRRPLDMSNESDSLTLGRMILKLADVNSASKPPCIHQMWGQKILEEFFDQGDEEISRGLPVSDFMDRRTCNVAELQCSFMNHVVSPLLNALVQAELLPVDEQTGRCELLDNFAENLRHWSLSAENGSSDPSLLFDQAEAFEEDTYAHDVLRCFYNYQQGTSPVAGHSSPVVSESKRPVVLAERDQLTNGLCTTCMMSSALSTHFDFQREQAVHSMMVWHTNALQLEPFRILTVKIQKASAWQCFFMSFFVARTAGRLPKPI
uniref:PDEase domain-containing protein n=1 Tax=Trichuris muris TaxID=70415 RepID=A0A5S6QA97_TRIMR